MTLSQICVPFVELVGVVLGAAVVMLEDVTSLVDSGTTVVGEIDLISFVLADVTATVFATVVGVAFVDNAVLAANVVMALVAITELAVVDAFALVAVLAVVDAFARVAVLAVVGELAFIVVVVPITADKQCITNTKTMRIDG